MNEPLSYSAEKPNLATLVLDRGSHPGRNDGVCLLEATAWYAGEKHSDHPRCVSHTLADLGMSINDNLTTPPRQSLIPLIPALSETKGDGLDITRRWMLLDWLLREWIPSWLDLARMPEEAELLRSLPEVKDSLALATTSLEAKKVSSRLDIAANPGHVSLPQSVEAAVSQMIMIFNDFTMPFICQLLRKPIDTELDWTEAVENLCESVINLVNTRVDWNVTVIPEQVILHDGNDTTAIVAPEQVIFHDENFTRFENAVVDFYARLVAVSQETE